MFFKKKQVAKICYISSRHIDSILTMVCEEEVDVESKQTYLELEYFVSRLKTTRTIFFRIETTTFAYKNL